MQKSTTMELPLMFVSFVLALPVLALGEKCTGAKVVPHVYTTTEGILSQETAFIVDFSITCSNNVKNINVYAEMNGQTIPATKVVGTNKYQVSLTGPHKDLPAGRYSLKLYDEDSFSELRKAMRSGEDKSNVESLQTILIDHPGAATTRWFESKFIATLLTLAVAWYAYDQKTKLAK